jgi:hypothetical protein
MPSVEIACGPAVDEPQPSWRLELRLIAVTYVPFAFVQWALVGRLFAVPRSTLTAADWQSFLLDLFLGFLVFAFARTAGAVAFRVGNDGLRAAYRVAASRFTAQLIATVLFMACGSVIVLIAAAVISLVAVMFGVAASGWPLIIVIGIVGVVTLPLVAWLVFAYEVATIRVAFAARASAGALWTAIGEIVGREPRRSLLAAAVLALIVCVASLSYSLLVELIPSPALRVGLTEGLGTLLGILIEGFSIAFLVAYETDVQIRYHGLDLVSALDERPPTLSSTPG